MEGGRFESEGVRLSLESERVLAHPEQVFDSDIESAKNESEEVRRTLERVGEISRRIESAELGSIAGQIQVAWPASRGGATVLVLYPITEGKGVEGAVFGYTAVYGKARKRGSHWELSDKGQSLEELFGVPNNLNLIVHPTVDRWTVCQGRLTSTLFGEDARDLYMGLGFLFLGQEWMYIGMHEAGHLPDGADENTAWTRANRENARRSRPDRKRIIAGESSGQFDILKEPNRNLKIPTIGDVEKYGLVSHFMRGNARIPKQWEEKSGLIMRIFKRIIKQAQDQYRYALQ